jgi:RNA polymerase sigma-70 factor (ECF subfamily)
VPLDRRDRYAEEWEAELLALPGGPVTKLVWTLRTRAGVRAFAPARAPSQRRIKAAKPSRAGIRRAELIDRAQAGDVQAFGDLYDEYSLTVYRYIWARTSSSALAEDLTGETFVQAVRVLDAFRWQDPDFAGWLERIAKTVITEQRQR